MRCSSWLGKGSSLSRSTSGCRSSAANHVEGTDIIIPTAIELTGINIERHRDVLALLDVELLDAVLTKDIENHMTRILSWDLHDIILHHPRITRALRNATTGLHYCNNLTC